MFNLFKKKEKVENEGIVLASPVRGNAVSLSQVNDPTFSEGMLGKGIAIIPEEGKIYAPAAGEISMVFDTLHAVSMTTDDGAEILIHVGLDTVKLKGEGYESHVSAGDRVEKGDLLLSVDLESVKNAGFDTITPVVVCNTDDYEDVKEIALGPVAVGDDVISIIKK